MAKIEKEEIKTVVTTVTLTLSHDETQMLRDVLYGVGGFGATRDLANTVKDALESVGYRPTKDNIEGSIYFMS